jgi:hypothetical protein
MSSGGNTQNLIAGSSVVISIASAVYSHQQISELKGEIETLKNHLAAVVPNVNPDMNKRLEHCFHAIAILNKRISDINPHKQIENLPRESPPVPKSVKKYQRMTKRSDPEDVDHEDPELAAAVLALEQAK